MKTKITILYLLILISLTSCNKDNITKVQKTNITFDTFKTDFTQSDNFLPGETILFLLKDNNGLITYEKDLKGYSFLWSLDTISVQEYEYYTIYFGKSYFWERENIYNIKLTVTDKFCKITEFQKEIIVLEPIIEDPS